MANTLNFKKMTIDDIMSWCVANNQVAWLKAKASETKECKVYPRHTVEKVKNGETVKVSEADKSQPYKLETRPISFIDIKTAFVNEFMPELAPKAGEKAPTMYERIAALK